MYLSLFKDNPRRFLAHLGRLAVEQEDEGTFLGVLNVMYFEDAEADPMPDMLKPVPWPDVRRFFEQEAQDLFRRL